MHKEELIEYIQQKNNSLRNVYDASFNKKTQEMMLWNVACMTDEEKSLLNEALN